MKLFHTREVSPVSPAHELVVREAWFARMLNFAIALVLTVGLLGAAGFLVYLKLTGGLSDELNGLFFWLATPSALVAGLVTLTFLRASLRKSNWLLRVRQDELILKFRSDSNARLPEPHPVVVSLPLAGVRWARHTREWVIKHSLSQSDGATRSRAHFLDLKLRISSEELEDLRRAINTEISYKPGPGPALFHHYPVRLDDDLLRVQWWAGVRPRVGGALSRLRHSVSVERDLDLTIDFTKPVSGADAEDKILELARRGEKLAAVGHARRTFGFSLAEAKDFVEDLIGPGREAESSS